MKTNEAYHRFYEFTYEHDPRVREIWQRLSERPESPPQISAELLGICLGAISGTIMGSAITGLVMYLWMRP